jgi:hypothetical protein
VRKFGNALRGAMQFFAGGGEFLFLRGVRRGLREGTEGQCERNG